MRATLWLDTGRPWPDLLDLARKAHDAKWDALRVCDVPAGADCWVVLGALAGAGIGAQLQAVVDDEWGRHPAVVAKLASTVDRLSGGRVLLGWAPAGDADAHARLEEGFQVVKWLALDERATFRGRFYRLQDAPLEPKPRQQPFPLMLVGGTAELAARIADHWSLAGAPDEVGGEVAALRAACQRSGRDPGSVTVSAPYPATEGVDEWVVQEARLGATEAERMSALARIPAEARAIGRAE